MTIPRMRGYKVWIGARGEVLLFFAVLDCLYALRMFQPPDRLPDNLAWAEQLMPLWVWGTVWVAVGLTCLVGAFFVRDLVPYTAAAMLQIGWGVWTLVGWLTGRIDGGYVQAVIWLGAAFLVFRIGAGVPAPTARSPRGD